MSTTELTQSADAGAATGSNAGSETAPPELQTAGDAHQQNGTDEGSDQSSDEGGGDKLTPEQRTIKKLEARISRLTAKKGGAEREADMYRQQLAEIQQRASQQGEDIEHGEGRTLTEADIDRLATQKAEEKARQKAIGERVGKVLKDGAKLDGFNAAVDVVAEVVPFTDKKGKPTPFIEAVLEADEPAAVLKYLGDNPDEAEDLAGLNPVQLGRRIAKLETKLAGAKKQTSAAPAPIKPVSGGHAGSSEPDPEKDVSAWIAARQKATARAYRV